jgi:ERCC4-type nuclease
MDIILKVDNRERAIHDHIRTVFCEKPMFCVNINQPEFVQLDTADFIIMSQSEDMSQTKILAIIERKTLEDYAASLKDGRIMNTEKLIRLREESGCQIYYLIEGNINTGYDSIICGIEYYKILANIRDAQILHGINILNTSNKLHTARELKFLLERYTSLYENIESKLKVNGSFDQLVEKCKPTQKQLLRNELIIIWTNLLSKSDKIKTQITPSNKAVLLSTMFSLSEWLNGKITEEKVAAIKVNNRRLDGFQIEMLSKPMTPELQLKALICMKGISEQFAKDIMNTLSLVDILKDKNTAQVYVSDKKLGKAKREKICTLFKGIIKD